MSRGKGEEGAEGKTVLCLSAPRDQPRTCKGDTRYQVPERVPERRESPAPCSTAHDRPKGSAAPKPLVPARGDRRLRPERAETSRHVPFFSCFR